MKKYIQHITLALCLLFCFVSNAQTYNAADGATITACSGTFYDTGGSTGAYSSSEDITYTICSGTGDEVELAFTVFDIESTYESFTIYDGNSATGTPIFQTTANLNPGTITSTTGCLTIVFVSDASVTGDGWAATISCPSCTDGIQNGTETGIDCGGPNCVPCPNCYNGIQDGNETGIDCGPSCPEPCHCSNGVQDGDELGVDCGGSCDPCPIECNVEVSYTLAGTGVVTYPGGSSYSVSDGGTINTCGGTFYDPGGSGAGYNANDLYTMTFCSDNPDPDAQIVFNFTTWDLENCCDYLSIYDGTDASGTLLFSGHGSTPPGTVQSTTGCLYFSWDSDFSGQADGWVADIGCYIPPSIDCNGGDIELTAVGVGQNVIEIDNDFDAGDPGAGWTATTAATYSNPCYPSADGGTYMWMGSASPVPRSVETLPLDLSCGGELCFLLALATQGNASPCEGPDEPDEGVSLQYTIDGGTTWVDIAYWNPNGTLMTSNPETDSPTTSGSTAFTGWNQYCFDLPPAAFTAATAIRWIQPFGTSATNDHWGLDNVTIASFVDCTPYVYDWDHIGGVDNGDTDTEFISSTTTFIVTYTNQVGDYCSTEVTVPVPESITVTGTATDETCLGACDGTGTAVVAGATGALTYLWSNGDATVSTSALCPGTHTVTATDAGVGCSAMGTITVEPGVSITAQVVVDNNASCFDVCDGQLTVNMLTGTAPYVYSWSNGSGTATNNGLCDGSYSVTVTDDNGCMAIAAGTITEPSAITTTESSTDATCNGYSDGTGTINATGGTPTYSYIWSDASATSTSNVSNLPADLYYVTVTDDNGCEAIDSIRIAETFAITTTTSFTNSNCNQADGTATASSSGGNGAPFTYLWSNAAVGGTATNLVAAAYDVTVTDATGCTAIATQAVTDAGGGAVSITVNNHIDCFGNSNGMATASMTGGSTPYDYSWSNGSITNLANNLPVGSVNVTVTDGVGCIAVSTAVIDEPAILGATASMTCASVFGGSDGTTSSTVTGGTTAYSYLWNNGGTSANLSGVTAGTYILTVTDANGCTAITQTVVCEPQDLLTNPVATDAACFGGDGTLDITASGGLTPYSYEWFNSGNVSVATTSSVTGISADTYYAVVTTANGNPFTSATVTINEPSAVIPAIDFSTNASCDGVCDGTAQASASGGTSPYSYSWNDGQTNPLATNLCAGTYTVTILDNNLCPAATTVSITAPAPLTDALVRTHLTCYQSNDGSIQASASGGTTAYSYLWSNLETTDLISGLSAGNYSVTITDNNGCSIIDNSIVTEPAELTLTMTSTLSTCNQADGSATVTVISGATPFTYNWDNGATSAVANNLFSGNYAVTVSDVNGCTSLGTIPVNDAGAPTISILSQSDVTCFGGNDGLAQVIVTGGATPLSYVWSDGQTTVSAVSLIAGTHSATMTDDNGCKASINVVINEPTLLVGAVNNIIDVTCFNYSDGQATALGSGGTTPYSYAWNDGQTTVTAVGLATGGYVVAVTDLNNCSQLVNVSISPADQIILATSTTPADCGSPSGSACVIITNGIAPFSYEWNNGQADSCAAALIPGTYTATVTDANGCFESVSGTVGDLSGGVATVVGSPTSCFGERDGTATASMSGAGTTPYNYLWSNFQNEQTATGLSAGTYAVTVTDVNTCISIAFVTITQPTALSVTTAATATSCASSCDGSITSTPNGGTPGYTFLWSDPLGQVSQQATGLCSGNYRVTVSDLNGCEVIGTDVVTEPSAISLTYTTVPSNCNQADGSGCVIASGGSAPYGYLWPDGTDVSCSIGLTSNAYMVTVTDANGCSNAISVVINDLSGPTAEIIDSSLVTCFNACDGTAEVSMIGGTGSSYAVAWFDGSTQIGSNPIISNLCSGTFSVMITDDANCSATTTVLITEPTELIYSEATVDPTCFGYCDGTASVNIVGGTTPYTTTWSTGVTNNGITTDQISNLCDGSYDLTVVDDHGCNLAVNYVLNEPAAVALTATSTNVNCFNACDGVAEATASSGVLPYSYAWSAGQATAIANNLCAGTHQVTVTDANGCSATQSTNITEPTELTGNVDDFGNVDCFGGNNGHITVLANGGTPGTGYSYLWTGLGNQPNSVNGLTANVYNVTITDENDCQVILTQPITQPTQLTSSIIVIEDQSCFNICDGLATASAVGGTAPYFYQWDGQANFQTGPTASSLCANNDITVTITDAKNCLTIVDADIARPLKLAIDVTIDSSHCSLSDGSIQVSVMGGVPQYVYTWTSPTAPGSYPTTSALENVPAGLYNYNVLDANGCTLDSLLSISDILGPDVSGVATPLTCFEANDGALNFFVNSGTAPFNFHWVFDNDTLHNLTDIVSSVGLAGGNYTFIAEDVAGCKDFEVIYVAEPPVMQGLIYNVINATCFGDQDGSANVIVQGGNGGGYASNYTYMWSNAEESTATSALFAGTYSVVATDAVGCSIQLTTTITQPTPLEIVQNVTDAQCFESSDGSIVTTVSGSTPGYNYAWSPLQAPNSIITNLVAGDYHLTVTDINGCTATSSATINEPQILASTTSMTPSTCSSCNGEGSVLPPTGGTAPYTYLWSNGDATSTATNLCAITYDAVVTDAQGCTLSLAVSVTDLPSPTVDITFTEPRCNGENTGTATAITNAGGGLITGWQWDGMGSQTSPLALNLPADTYHVTVTDENGCTATNVAVIGEPQLFEIIVAATEPVLCEGQSTQIYATPIGGTSPYNSFNWNAAAQPYAGPTTSIFNVSPPAGSMTFFGTNMVDANGCYAEDSVGVTVSPALGLNVPGILEMCIGNSESICVTASGGQAIDYTFVWSTGQSTNTAGEVSSCISVTPTATGTYVVHVTDGCSTPLMDTIPVIIHPLPPLDINSDIFEGCPPLTPEFEVNIGEGFPNATVSLDVNYDGSFDFEGTSHLNSHDMSYAIEYLHSYENSGTFSVYAQVTSEHGCVTSTVLADYINVFPSPIANFNASPQVLTLIDPTVLVNGDATVGVENPDNLTWTFGDGNSANGYTAQNTYTDTGRYDVLLVAENDYGCIDTALIELVVESEFVLYTPNAFTPNGDGLNDEFFPKGVGINPNDFTFTIYNRWGELIFSSTNLDDHWDGIAREKGGTDLVPTGVYIWHVVTSELGKSDAKHSYMGHVTLLK